MIQGKFKGTIDLQKEVVIHLLFWLLYFYFVFVNFDQSQPYFFTIRDINYLLFNFCLVYLATFYFNYILVMPRVFKNFTWMKPLLGFFLSYLFFISLRFFSEEVIIRWITGRGNYDEDTTVLYYIYDNLYFSTLVLIPSSLLWLLVFIIRLIEYNAFISEEKKEIEIKFLKSQLNPHFIFNSLNNIYSLAYFKSEKALLAIEKFSDMMRYTTYKSQKDEISLQEEINYIKSIIELEQLRHEGEFKVVFETDEMNCCKKIPPLILFPLVENALKHGFLDKEHPLHIYIRCSNEKLYFKVKNIISNNKKDAVAGIGNQNLKKRLDIYFPQKHVFNSYTKDDIYLTELEINFK